MYEALSLALHRELAHEVTDEGVAAKGADVRASNGEHLAEESLEENFISESKHDSNFLEGREIQTDLYEAVEAADLPEVRCLPDEEEADVAEIPLDLGAGNIGERGEVDGVAVLGGSLKRLDRCGIHATFRPNI